MFAFQKNTAQPQKLCTSSGIRVLVVGLVLVTYAALSFQGFTFTPGGDSSPFFLPASPELGEVATPHDRPKNSATPIQEEQNRGQPPAAGAGDGRRSEMGEADEDPDDVDLDGGESVEDDESPVELGDIGARIRKAKDPHGGHTTPEEEPAGAGNSSSADMGFKPASSRDGTANSSLAPSYESHPVIAEIDKKTQDKQSNESDASAVDIVANISSSGEVQKGTDEVAPKSGEKKPLPSGVAVPDCRPATDHAVEKGKSAATGSEMYQKLLENWRSSNCSMVPRWSSPIDGQILEAKRQILDAPTVENDTELYSPLFRNVSMFKRSYELMEKMLKVYVYKEGEPPVFHQPPLGGIYASEGWFMKQMESSRRFVVDDPGQANLFYMPFSSSRLRFELYVPGSHGHRNLVEYLRSYVGTIARKYPFWNRTGGADHFLAACHDWAADETAKAMGNTIRALCNADLTEGFELGKDVSLPETNVPFGAGKDPQRYLGGRPSKKRPFLAFFAGQMHGYIRPILLQHWENKHPDMKISGPLPRSGGGAAAAAGGRRRKRKTAAAYVQYMRSSRYCICPRGYEVNSPRVVEAIVHGCIPVIIADGFVPPFFEVLDWEAFAVVLAEAEVPRLREVLAGIPRKKFLSLQAGVREVRKHFLWNQRPARYDLFHMILHSVWLNRVLGFHAR